MSPNKRQSVCLIQYDDFRVQSLAPSRSLSRLGPSSGRPRPREEWGLQVVLAKGQLGCHRIMLPLLNQSVVDGVEGQFEPVRNPELVENVMEVVFDGLSADEELFPDFLVPVALSDQLDDLLLAVAEQGLFAARAAVGGLGKGLHHLRSNAVVEPDLAGVHAINALDQQVGGGLLQNHPACAQTHGADDIAVIFGGGQNDDAGGQRVEVDFLQHSQAILVRHAQVEQQNVRLELGEHLDAFGAVRGFANDGDVLIALQQAAETIAEDGVVIGD